MIELDKGDIKKDVANMSEGKEIVFGKSKYMHTSDKEYDYLLGEDKGIKFTFKFSKDKERNKTALEGIRTFFSWL